MSIHELFRPRDRDRAPNTVSRYRLHVARQFVNYPGAPGFSAEAFANRLSGATIRGFQLLPLEQGYDVEVELERAGHEEALEEMSVVLGQFGLQLLQASVIEVVNLAVESAFAGGAGGGLIGANAKNPGAALAGALLGAAVGVVVGSQIERVTAAYMAARPYPLGSWQLTPVPLDAASRGSQA